MNEIGEMFEIIVSSTVIIIINNQCIDLPKWRWKMNELCFVFETNEDVGDIDVGEWTYVGKCFNNYNDWQWMW